MGLAVSPTGQVASASFDNSVGLWRETLPIWLEGHSAAVVAVAFLRDGVVISGGDDFALRLWDGENQIELARHQGKIADIAVSPDGQTIATASWDGTVGLWQVVASETPPHWSVVGETLQGHGSSVNDVAFSSDGTRLYSASSDGTIRVWDRDGAQSRVLASNGFAVNRLSVNDVDRWLAYGAVDGVTRMIDIDSGVLLADFTLERRPILAMAYHADTQQLVIGDGEGYIMVIDTEARRITRDFRATQQGPVWALALSPDGQTVYAGGLDDNVYAWPIDLLDRFEPGISGTRSFLRDVASMPNGERQFMRKCSICHALEPGPSRKAGPTLYEVFGRRAGTVQGYLYSATLDGSHIIWTEETINDLFEKGPDHYIPGSKMPMQVIAGQQDRADLIGFLKVASAGE